MIKQSNKFIKRFILNFKTFKFLKIYFTINRSRIKFDHFRLLIMGFDLVLKLICFSSRNNNKEVVKINLVSNRKFNLGRNWLE